MKWRVRRSSRSRTGHAHWPRDERTHTCSSLDARAGTGQVHGVANAQRRRNLSRRSLGKRARTRVRRSSRTTGHVHDLAKARRHRYLPRRSLGKRHARSSHGRTSHRHWRRVERTHVCVPRRERRITCTISRGHGVAVTRRDEVSEAENAHVCVARRVRASRASERRDPDKTARESACVAVDSRHSCDLRDAPSTPSKTRAAHTS